MRGSAIGHGRDQSSSDSNAEETDEENPNANSARVTGAGLIKALAPSKPSAEANDPVYSMARDKIPGWPCQINARKRLRPVKYTGGGWPMHFRNPQFPRKLVNIEDLRRVAANLASKFQFSYHVIKQSAPGTVQLNLGTFKGSGNIQLYTSRLGRTQGNARIAVGNAEDLKAIRKEVLRSQWFADALVAPALDKVPGNEQGRPDLVFQPDGKILLPVLSVSSAEDVELRNVLKKIHSALGAQGKKAMKAYMKECGIIDRVVASAAVKQIIEQMNVSSSNTRA